MSDVPYDKLSELCIKCGAKCCKKVLIPSVMNNIFDKQFITTWGFDVYPNPLIEGTYAIVVDKPCKYLRKNNTCSIYDKRPLHCVEFNGVTTNFPGCLWRDLPEDELIELLEKRYPDLKKYWKRMFTFKQKY